MLPEQFFQLVADNDAERLNLLKKKANDYAREADVLSNFKRISGIASILGIGITSPRGYAVFMILLKLDRICNLLFSNKTPSNESVADSIQDLIGYANLLLALILEESDASSKSLS